MKKLSREEAKKILEDMKVKIEIPKAAVTQLKRNAALDMAIEALKYSEFPNNSDTISRQAAIDCLGFTWPEDAIRNLPSAQPEIIRCKDCRWQKDQSGATAWLPCRALVTPEDFYCGRAERRTDG